MKQRLLFFLPLLAACSSPTSPPGEVSQATAPAPEAASPAPNAIVDAQNGYGGHHLGDSLGSITDVQLQLVPRPLPATMYTIPSHRLRLDTVPVNGISYEFWKDKLYRIDFNSKRPGLLAAGKRLYGEGVQVSPTEYRWPGTHASASYSENGEWTYLRIFDNRAAAQVDSATAAATPGPE
ncbi:hypothetical protein ACFST9_21525 [Hymenobacter monticola]|uniref:Lipoprotein n=1 Tax=Hymenobacter monticola TaxID=1705399 RepID=A0ABY4B698_9BACT|nr:hypothetical protein [Hymenobacter monticola]UOE34319.1 hypothetical protein MTP16_01385 [Hymenobacter monticola]